jgi:hypothetical protein
VAKTKFIPYGSDASAGTYECVDCDYELNMQSTKSLPPCPKYDKETHIQNAWRAVTGQGDAKDDPYPDRNKH